MKFIAIQHRFGGYTSHHFNETYGFMQELGRRGKKYIPLIHMHAERRIVDELRARPVLEDPTFRLEWTFEERSERFVTMLHRQVDRLVREGDCVMLTIATQLEAHALTRWVQELPPRKKPWVVVCFLSDRWNRSGPDEYERQMPEFRKLKAAIAALGSHDARRMIFCAITERLAGELSGLLGTPVAVAPMPLPYREPPPRDPAKRRSAPPRVALLGGLRRDKGSYLIPDIVRACRPRVSVEFLVQLMNNNLTDEEAARVAEVAKEPGVTTLDGAMTLPDYEAALDQVDIGLFPYEVIPYRQRSSGVFGEVVAAGKPVVVTAGTWMAEQIEAGRAAGIIAAEVRAESFADAVARCVADLEALERTAQAVSAAWRRTNSLPAFVDFMEGEIAARSKDVPPRRRFLWW